MSVTERFNLKVGDFQLLESPVEKHGTHDQKTHGNWATGVSSDVASTIQQFTREWGGLSISMVDGSMPTTGYMVAKPSSFSKVVDEADFFDPVKGPKILSQYMREQRADLATGKNYLGTWLNGGKIFLDVSENISDVGKATRLGRERDQIAIWDVANQVEVDTGGTGGVEKESRNGGVEELSQYDGRGNRRLRVGDLEKVRGESGQVQVIRFEYGLKPILKHGTHTQADHGNWARGYTAEEIARVEAMKELGPTVDDLNSAIKEAGAYSATDEQLKLIVENDQDLYNDATAGIDTIVEMRLANLQEEFPNHVYTEQEKSTIYENVQNEMIDGYIESQRDTLTELSAGMDSGEFDVGAQDLIPFFDEVYGVTHTGDNFDGEERTISSQIYESQIGYRGEGSVIIDGSLNNENGEQVGFIQREFFKENGVWNVEHLALVIEEDDYKGTGFGKEIIQNSEAWYVSRGFGYIEVSTAMDGGRHWARAGYDFNPEYLRENARALINSANDRFDEGTPERIEFDNLMGRYLDGYVRSSEPMYDSVRDMKDERFPLPADFANIGYTPGAKEWAGKTLMASLSMKYVKVLTPEGQKLMDGPIDHDGDGLIYDGTSREKPAPSGGNK
jgi:hypothetical protein